MSDSPSFAGSGLPGVLAAYSAQLERAVAEVAPSALDALAADVNAAWQNGRQLFICGNGGSAANAVHLANDFFYGVAPGSQTGMRVHALPANTAITTCLGNDIGYERIFSEQLIVLANPDDVLLVLSGSGNSPNIVEALKQARQQGIRSHAILGFDGGKALGLADNALHVGADDMQIAEDAQMVIGHALMQLLNRAASAAEPNDE